MGVRSSPRAINHRNQEENFFRTGSNYKGREVALKNLPMGGPNGRNEDIPTKKKRC